MASHAVGILLGFLAIVLTIQCHKDRIGFLAGMFFAASLILLYTASCLYHGIPDSHPRAKRILQVIDHCSIFVLIAESGTPFILCVIGRFSIPSAAVYNLLLWGCAVVGIILLSISLKKFKRLSIVLYLIMGFSILAKTAELKAALGMIGFSLLVAGGIIYCVGLAFYSIKMRWFHAAFHVLCIIASTLHCICVFVYIF